MSPRAVLIGLSLEEFREAADLPADSLLQMVEEGILEPRGVTPADWRFEIQMLRRARRAARLHRDLDINWSGIALALELLGELEQLKGENRLLRRRLARFLEDQAK